MTSPSTTEELDAVILGAGVAGLYQLHQLREQGLRVRAIDKAGDVGGTWWWNRYPGARFDSEAYIYQYYFDEQLYKDWSWSEKFPGQPEVEQWLHYVHRPARPAQGTSSSPPPSPAPTSTRTAAAGRSPRTRATSSTPSSS
jgi:cation diffusion facilitator CzcD-associated flavoprotein CzcO